MPKLLGAKLRYLRKGHHLTQVELASLLDLTSQAYISNIEVGRQVASLDLIVSIADFFGVTTDYLLRDTQPVESVAPVRPDIAELSQPQIQPLGVKLRHLRRERKLTQGQVAQQLRLQSHVHISHLEAGRHKPSIELLLQFADLFGVTTDLLLREDIPDNVGWD